MDWVLMNLHPYAESVIVLPPHGVQFETHRGLPPFLLFSSRQFIPSDALQDVVINEGLRRWDVRYYLVAVKRFSPYDFKLIVAFEVGWTVIFSRRHYSPTSEFIATARGTLASLLWHS